MSILSILTKLASPLPTCTEADIQSDVKALLVEGAFTAEETPLLEVPTGDGTSRRIDVEYGALVIECKKSIDHTKKAALAEAEKQLAGYLSTRQEQSGQLWSGILTDGAHWRNYRLAASGVVDLVSTFDLEPTSGDDRPFRDWLGSALPTETKVVPSAVTIEGRLGATSPSHAITASRLAELLTIGMDIPEVVLKRELWAKLLRTAFGTQFEGSDGLFVEHTYLVVLATLIARAALGLPPNEPANRLLSGESFAEQGITGVGEAGFFDWMLAVDGGDDVIADIARRVQCFDWSKTDHDVLKALYQSVISPEVRHRLGEYYTPDWLADRIVIETVADPLKQRVLDPACGSGTFLFAAINHYFDAASAASVTTGQAVSELPAHVAGIDLHPVAVALAQVTYLLAVGVRLAERTGPFAVPVYLGDSMRWDDASGGATQLFHSTDDVVVHTTDGIELFASELRFPASVVGRPDFDSLVSEMTAKASGRKPGSVHPLITGVLAKYAHGAAERTTLETTYELLCKLHDDGRDHIWGYFVRNQARPAWFAQAAHRVDVLVGNPPWLSYRYMPNEMQVRFRERSKQRGLWRGGARGLSTQQELAAFFVARSVELYLKAEGRFSFVTPFAVLSRQSYEGFRTGRWTGEGGPNLGAHLGRPWSLLDVHPHPFPVPSAVVCGTRGHGEAYTAMPAVVESLEGKVTGSGQWNSVSEGITIVERPVIAASSEDEPGSAYGDRFRSGATLFPRMLVIVEDDAPVPFATNQQRSVRSRRSSLEKEPWKSLPGLAGAVEAVFVRPVLLGESIVPFAIPGSVEGVIPYTKGTGILSADDPRIEGFPGFAKWWQKSEETYLTHRPSHKRILIEQLNYMRQLEAQFPIAPIRIVYTASGTTLAATVVTDDRAVVEHGLYWAAVSSLAEGRYLCGVLNAPKFTEAIRPYQSEGAFGPRHFDKYVWKPPTPEFEAASDLHRTIVNLAEEAEQLASGVETPIKGGFQTHRKLVRNALIEAGTAKRLDEAIAELLHLNN